MQDHNIPYQRQILVCVHDRKGERPSCGDHQGEAVFGALRQAAKDQGAHPRIRVTQVDCLGQCAQGVTVMIYPENLWHSHVRLADVPMLVEKYIGTTSVAGD